MLKSIEFVHGENVDIERWENMFQKALLTRCDWGFSLTLLILLILFCERDTESTHYRGEQVPDLLGSSHISRKRFETTTAYIDSKLGTFLHCFSLYPREVALWEFVWDSAFSELVGKPECS